MIAPARRTSRPFLGMMMAAGVTLVLAGCLVTAALVGAIRAAATGEGGGRAQVRLERPANEVYQAILDMEDGWRDAHITKANPRTRKVTIAIEKRSADIKIKIVYVRPSLSTVKVAVRSGDLRMTDQEFAASILERLCRELRAKCYRLGSDEDPDRPQLDRL